MKQLIIALLMLLTVSVTAQRSTISDPSLGKFTVSGTPGQNLDAENLPLDKLVRLTLPISNNSAGNVLPAGSCKIKIGLGSKLTLDPNFSVINADLHDFPAQWDPKLGIHVT